jgi:mRNA-degrading endonuclease RelE of RelBE toxin-antitoxin system
MEFIETSVFTRQLKDLLEEDEYRAFQIVLLLRPEQGTVIKGSGGLRKIRWGHKGSGKRGGIRVVYYWDAEASRFYMLFAYPKSVQDDLTTSQLRTLRRLVREELK